MARAYLKIMVEPGKESEVKSSLLGIGGVKSADLTTGEQDIICLIEADSYEVLLNLVIKQLRPIAGVTRTVTNLILE